MNREISQRELRNQSADVLRAVENGETVTITRHGEPVAELVPLRRRRFVRMEAVLEAFGNAPAIDLQSLRDDLDAIAGPPGGWSVHLGSVIDGTLHSLPQSGSV